MGIERGVILAAGRGSRLGSLTDAIPKPMLEIGDRPLIDHIVAAMAEAGVRRIAVVTGYHGDVVEWHLALTSQVPIAFVRQIERRGTGDALELVRAAIGNEAFLLSWGDIVTAVDHYVSIAEEWQSDIAAVIGVNELEDVSSGSSVVFDDERNISAIIEKPQGEPPSRWNSSGVMALGPQVWPHVETLTPSARGELELTDALGSLVAAGERVRAALCRGYWFDIGTPESLARARAAVKDRSRPK